MKDSSFSDISGLNLLGLRPRPRTDRPLERATLAKLCPRLPVIPAIRMSMIMKRGLKLFYFGLVGVGFGKIRLMTFCFHFVSMDMYIYYSMCCNSSAYPPDCSSILSKQNFKAFSVGEIFVSLRPLAREKKG